MNTTDSNKLIAEFMGKEVITEKEFLAYEVKDLNNKYLDVSLGYHKDWNSLMQVINRVIETGYAGGITYDLKESLIAVDIDNTYNEVVNFIKWYNVKIAQKENKTELKS